MPLVRAIYFSTRPSDRDPQTDLDDITASCLRNNTAVALTGCLLRVGQTYLQCLEGRRRAVNALLDTISRDPRHVDMTITSLEDVDERLFAGWTMAKPDSERVFDLIDRFAVDHVFVPTDHRGSTFKRIFEEVATWLPKSQSSPSLTWDVA
jgi:hypothetical protein